MKTITTLIMLALCAGAQARLGETVNECMRRYGEPVKVDQEKMALVFSKEGLLVAPVFREGKCVMLGMVKEEKVLADLAQELSPTEIEALLEANKGESEWETLAGSLDRQWRTKDGKRLASYSTDTHWLILTTTEEKAAQDAVKASAEKAKLKGF